MKTRRYGAGMMTDFTALLRGHGLRDTKPRRAVLKALSARKMPLSRQEICAATSRLADVNTVTVYRMIAQFEECGLVHRHPSTGKFALCSLQGTRGHHGFLTCRKCEGIEEFADSRLCLEEDRVARSNGFRAECHISDIVGLCSDCQ